ncbi:hypothetical protein K461DRAFT_266762 [Myriangium duriaei CBS 260.36]|uniref:Rhodopsin domain-containing protein n=1 Tax=Myriangium duriaei CBS 260.36 TaxID=1168546 RepID=A0A9P4J5L3_9PEZI|nr:hypothetical protein K461DRAFT_266762 [Myriangium duriaei CBS 260.36]
MHLEDLGPAVVQSIWIQISIAVIIVALRAYTASRSGDRWRWDFIWILLSLILAVASAICNTISATHGMGSHISHLSIPEIKDLLFWTFLGIYLGTLSIACITGGLTDIFLALFPIIFVWDLKTSMKIKIGFCALMGVGIIPGIVSLYRIHTLGLIYHELDATYALGTFSVWAGVEMCSLIILGSIPPLRPLFKKGISKVSTKARTTNATLLLKKTEVHTHVDRLEDVDVIDYKKPVVQVAVLGGERTDML